MAGDDGTRALPDKSMYGWTDIPVPSNSVDPRIVKTLTLQANYFIDIKRAKNMLIIQVDFPNSPNTLLNDILLDNLNIMLNNSSSPTQPSKSIHTHSDWLLTY